MFTSFPTHILCWEDSWKPELISDPLPVPHKHAGCAKSRCPHVTAANVTQAAGREQPPPSSLSSSSPAGRSPPVSSTALAPSLFLFFFLSS